MFLFERLLQPVEIFGVFPFEQNKSASRKAASVTQKNESHTMVSMDTVQLKSARTAGIIRLYHYEKFNAEYLSSVLRDQKIHCSNPANLNDPWDCKPWFNSRSLENPEVLESTIRWFHGQGEGDLRDDLKSLWENRLRDSHKERTSLIAGLSEQNIVAISGRRIYCVTPHPDSTLMWSHYAENHRGICFEFATDNELFGSALAVFYRRHYPAWVPHEFEAQQRRAIEMILTKSKDWQYEDEFRIVGTQFARNAGYLRPDGDYFRLPPGALKAVIVGCEADRNAITAVVNKHMPQLPVQEDRPGA